MEILQDKLDEYSSAAVIYLWNQQFTKDFPTSQWATTRNIKKSYFYDCLLSLLSLLEYQQIKSGVCSSTRSYSCIGINKKISNERSIFCTKNASITEISQATLYGYCSTVLIISQNWWFMKLVLPPSRWSKTWRNKGILILIIASYFCWLLDLGESTEIYISQKY